MTASEDRIGRVAADDKLAAPAKAAEKRLNAQWKKELDLCKEELAKELTLMATSLKTAPPSTPAAVAAPSAAADDRVREDLARALELKMRDQEFNSMIEFILVMSATSLVQEPIDRLVAATAITQLFMPAG